MNSSIAATKGNLIRLKKSLELAKLGFDLMDRKKNVLLKEIMPLVEVSKSIKKIIGDVFKKAYLALQAANITTGFCEEIANGVEIETGLLVSYRNVMGISIPKVTLNSTTKEADYGTIKTNSKIDEAYISFEKAKEISIMLSEIENSLFFLSKEIKKTKIRANALKNIVIPKIEENIEYITNSLEEKEREEFARLKILKKTKQ